MFFPKEGSADLWSPDSSDMNSRHIDAGFCERLKVFWKIPWLPGQSQTFSLAKIMD